MTTYDELKERMDDVFAKVNDRRDFTPDMLAALEGLEAVQIGEPTITRAELVELNGEAMYDGEAGHFLYRLDRVYDALREVDADEAEYGDEARTFEAALVRLEAAAAAL